MSESGFYHSMLLEDHPQGKNSSVECEENVAKPRPAEPDGALVRWSVAV